MNGSSYPSTPVIFVDIPEVTRVSAEFTYGFFVPDESNDTSGRELSSTPVSTIDPTRSLRNVPRYVSITFLPGNVTKTNTRNEFRPANDNISSLSLKTQLNHVVFEHQLTSTAFTGIRFQDDLIDEKLFTMLSSSFEARVDRFNRGVSDQFAATQRSISNILSRANVNLLDAGTLMSAGHDTIDAKLIVDGMNRLRSLNTRFIDESERREMLASEFDVVKDVGHDVQLNAKFASTLLSSVVNDPLGLYNDEITPMLVAASRLQSAAQAHVNVNVIDAAEFEPSADPVAIRRVTSALSEPVHRIVGFIIDRFEVSSSGELLPLQPIIVENPNATKAYDVNVAYGRRYAYAVRTIASVEFPAYDDAGIVLATVLISSKASQRYVVETVEHVPPPPPVDIDVRWDRGQNVMRLSWSFPTNTQRDIKRWQVFRRQTIYEPYTLLKEYNFDDSNVKYTTGEEPNASVTSIVTSPVNYYMDHDFNTSSTAIYAICAIDAHGMSSNYSEQFEVKFDQQRNGVVKRRISPSGAPKAYPNVFVTCDDVFVDVLRDSGHKQLDVYFDPEYLDIVDRSGQVGLLATDKNGGMYRLQLINTDLQQAQMLDITLRDIRTKKL